MANKKKEVMEFHPLAKLLRVERFNIIHQAPFKNWLTKFLRRVFVEELKTKCVIKFNSEFVFYQVANDDTMYINDSLLDNVVDYLTNNGFLLSNKEYNVFEVHLED